MIFDYKCPSCNRVQKDVYLRTREEVVVCKQCHAEMQRLFPNRFTFLHLPKEGLYLEHVSAKGKTFYSFGEMKKYARKNDLELSALL